MDPLLERAALGIAHALFINRLHVLRLTEVVRNGIRPNPEDGNMELPEELDRQMRQQAIDYVYACLPEEFHPALTQAKVDWLRPA
jgi:hypothetical protein